MQRRRAQPAPAPEIHVLALIDHLVLGGAEMLLGKFAAVAPARGVRVSVACLQELDGNPAAGPVRDAGAPLDNLDLPGRPNLHALLAVRRHIAAIRPDIVHTHLGDSDLLGVVAAVSLRIPAVSTIHTSVWDGTVQTKVRRWIVNRCAARVIAVSDSARAAYLEHGRIRPERLVTIHNGIDVSPVPGAGREVRAELGWSPSDLVVGMVSALRPLKAHGVALAAVRQLLPEFPALRLLIVGHGPAWDDVARAAAPFGDRVAMVGRREDVMRYFDAFDLCLHPSLSEAFPTSLIEAMAASVPVVATATGGIPEIVADGDTGLLVPAPPAADALASALAALLREPQRRRSMGAAGRELYERRFTAGPWIRSIRELYDDVLAGARGRRRGPQPALAEVRARG